MQAREDVHLAIGRYESYVKADPGNPLLWLNLGDLYHKVARFEEAIACFERCQHDHPQYTSALSHLASVMLSQHRFVEAERLLLELLRDSEDPALLFNLGLALYYQQRWPEAEDALLRARDQGMSAPDCYAYLARCRHFAGDTEQAIQLCQQWIDAARNADSCGYLALLHMDHGNMADAEPLAREALASSPDNAQAAIVVGIASIEMQEMERARESFERVLVREPDNARAWLGMGLVCLYEQKPEDAIAALERATQLLPDNVGIAVTLGWAAMAAKQSGRAEKVFRHAIEIDHNFGEAHGGLASVFALQVRVDEAKEAIRLARRLDPHGFGAAFAQTVILKIHGRDQAATELLTNLLTQAPRPNEKTLIQQIELFLRKNPPQQPPTASAKHTHRGNLPGRQS